MRFVLKSGPYALLQPVSSDRPPRRRPPELPHALWLLTVSRNQFILTPGKLAVRLAYICLDMTVCHL